MKRQIKINKSFTANPSFKQKKDTTFIAQKQIVLEAFKRSPATMLMVSIETGILRANICRYVSEWLSSGELFLYKDGLCKISKYPAGYYTANKDLVFNPQYSLIWN